MVDISADVGGHCPPSFHLFQVAGDPEHQEECVRVLTIVFSPAEGEQSTTVVQRLQLCGLAVIAGCYGPIQSCLEVTKLSFPLIQPSKPIVGVETYWNFLVLVNFNELISLSLWIIIIGLKRN